MELKNKVIAFLGDSITAGSGASAPEFVYHQVLKKNCGLKDALNFGIGGTRLARQQNPDGTCPVADANDFLTRVDKMPKDVDAVVVFGGTNDFGHGDAPFGTFGDKTADTFYGACYELMETLISRYPEIPIVFLTPLHRRNEANSVYRGVAKNLSLCDYVCAIREVAEYFSIPVLDLYAESGMQPNVEAQNKAYFADGLHPNDNGYKKIADKLEKFLKAL